MKNHYRRIFLIVLDSLGIGAMPDAADFGDGAVDTFGHICEKAGPLDIPNLERLGIYHLHPIEGVDHSRKPEGFLMKLSERSRAKDTMAGHWEMMGIETKKPFQTFTDTGFPKELIDELEKRCGRRVIGNKSASGTEILNELAAEEKDNCMIVYTSADSVLQICGNEQTFDLDNLYRCCEIARELTMKDEWKVGRVIARPYIETSPGVYQRTANRRDYAVSPPQKTVLDTLSENGLDVIGVGKIHDIFSGQGLTRWLHSDSSVEGMQQTVELAGEDFHGLCFVNLVDFDAKWGHRRNPDGYAREIEAFDKGLGALLEVMRPDDLLMITADHGNDPTAPGTDHTREYVPLICWSESMESGRMDGDSFGIIGATIADNFGVKLPEGCIGESVLQKL